MIGRKSHGIPKTGSDDVTPQGFDDFIMKLGDVMRGERATLGKSLLDVQRELRIKASYIAAIENCDPSAFDTPGFIAGYVRSYARYLNMDPEETFAAFCAESGFTVAHGMSEKASTIRKVSNADSGPMLRARDPFAEPSMPFSPSSDSLLSRIEPGAVGSTLVLLALVGGIGYGGWAVLQEVQRVQVAPVEQTPLVLSELDPLDAAGTANAEASTGDAQVAGLFTPPSTGGFDRLYRPEALDVPVLTSRDGPISTLDPDSVGLFARAGDARPPVVQDSASAADALVAELTAAPADRLTGAVDPVIGTTAGVTLVAARPVWVRVSDANGRILFTDVMNAGATYSVPSGAEGTTLRVGESGSIYFAVNGQAYGPAGPRGNVTDGIILTEQSVKERYQSANLQSDRDLDRLVAELDVLRPMAIPAEPVQLAEVALIAPTALDQPANRERTLPQLRAYRAPAVPARPRVEPEPQPLEFAELTLTDTASGLDADFRPQPRSDTVAALGEELRIAQEAEAVQLAEAQTAAPVVPVQPFVPVQPVDQAERVEPVLPFAQAERVEPVAPFVQTDRVQPVQPVVPQPRVLAEALPGVTIIATHEAWVEVTSPSGTKLHAKLMLPGDTISVAQTEQPPTIFTGDAGAIYFVVNGQTYGPYGTRGQFGRNLMASAADVQGNLAVADLTQAPELVKIVAELNAQALSGQR